MTRMRANRNEFDSTAPLRSADIPTGTENNLSKPPFFDTIFALFIPAATAFVGWLANRRYAALVKKNEALKEELQYLLEDMRNVQMQKGPYAISADEFGRKADIISEEEKEVAIINEDLDEISEHLQERQDIMCSHFTKRKYRHLIEENLKELAFYKPYDKDLRLYSGLIDIFQFDNHCDSYGYHRNGCLMWVYMDMWRKMAHLRKYKRVEERLLNEKGRV